MAESDNKVKKITLENIRTDTDLRVFLASNYLNQIKNFFGDEKQALKFLSSVMSSVQKTPELLNCDPKTVITSFMTMAQLGLMPSDISGEAYVLPYNKGQSGKIAQFQLGYQGLVTLFYRAGGIGIRSEIVRKNDKFSFINGVVKHEIDIFKSNKNRGEAVGAYVIANVNGQELAKVMNKEDILDMGKKFSKSFGTAFTAWKEENDPELWMWKKTVFKQLGKMLPKNETINRAISEDNKDSRISDIKEKGMVEESGLAMGKFLKDENKENNSAEKQTEKE
jgi:recombination protein RecT